jgi:hypothetical protein
MPAHTEILHRPIRVPAARRPRSPRAAARRRRQIADGLREVARLSAPSTPRRRFTAVIPARAAAVRDELLEVAALVCGAGDPDLACLDELHRLLTDGRTSPLLNPHVPAVELAGVLQRTRCALEQAATWTPA